LTVGAIVSGLMPVMWAAVTGADTMKRIAAPMIGGLVSSTILTLILLPAIFTIWKGFEVRRRAPRLQSHAETGEAPASTDESGAAI
jgi:Cu(I)/Ag(I) efflux system membrane protein CusA/SilA